MLNMSIKPNKISVEEAEKHLEEARGFHQQGQYQQAIDAFEQASRGFKENECWEQHVDTELDIITYQSGQLTFDGMLERLETLLEYSLTYLGDKHLFTATCYQKIGHYYLYVETGTLRYEVAYQKALACFDNHRTILQHKYGDDHTNLFTCYANLGLYWTFKENYIKALDYYEIMIQLLEKRDLQDFYQAGIFYRNIGICCYRLSKYNQALAWLQTALTFYQKQYANAPHPSIAATYWELSVCYLDKGDYDKSLQYTEQALIIRKETLGDEHIQVANCYHLMAKAYLKKEAFSEAEHYIQLFLDKVRDQENCDYNNLTFAHLSFGIILLQQKKLHQALAYFQLALKRFELVKGDNMGLRTTHSYLGECYLFEKEYKKGLLHIRKALQISQNIVGEKSYETSKNYTLLGDFYQEQEAYKEALIYYQKALNSISNSPKTLKIHDLPALEEVTHYLYFLDALKGKGTCHYQSYRKNALANDLEIAVKTYEVASKVVGKLRQNYSYEGSQLTLVSKAQALYEDAIGAFYYFYQQTQNLTYLNLCFQYCEKSKAIILLSQLKDAEAKIASNIPADLLQKEYDLQIEINYLNKQIQELQSKEPEKHKSNSTLEVLQSERFHYLQSYEKLIETIEVNYPHYHQLKYNIKTTSIQETQLQLEENQAIVNYFVGKENLFIFCITSNDAQILREPLPKDFEQMVEDFNESINFMFKRDYLELAYQLYQLLLEKCLSNEQSLTSNVLIVPDGILTQIPFEALLSSNVKASNSYADLPYLLMDYDIHYHYSVTLWHRSKAPANHPQEISIGESFIGFAPVYKNQKTVTPSEQLAFADETVRSVTIRGTTYQELIYSEQEVNEIQSLFKQKSYKTQTFLHQKASITNFKKSLKGYKYLHIAGHGYLNTEQPELSGILFSPTSISEQENVSETIFSLGDAYHLQLDADLVVLSCCESGIGKLAKGEGMIAINRGFLSAGAKNVIYTLFKVYDKASCELTQALFQHILEGKNYRQALKTAKLQLIRSGKATPRLWAGYVLIGR